MWSILECYYTHNMERRLSIQFSQPTFNGNCIKICIGCSHGYSCQQNYTCQQACSICSASCRICVSKNAFPPLHCSCHFFSADCPTLLFAIWACWTLQGDKIRHRCVVMWLDVTRRGCGHRWHFIPLVNDRDLPMIRHPIINRPLRSQFP